MTDFNQQKAIEDYTELMRRVSVGAYSERSTEHYETDTWPEDGVEESIHNLTELAAKAGREFLWHEESGTYALEPMSDETKFARRESRQLSDDADATVTSDGHLIVRNEGFIVTIDATEAWELLAWLHDFHKDRLYSLAQHNRQEARRSHE